MKPKQAKRIALQMQTARSFAKLAAGEKYPAEVAKRRPIIEKMVAETGGTIQDAAFGMVLSLQIHKPKRMKIESNLIFATAIEMIEGTAPEVIPPADQPQTEN